MRFRIVGAACDAESIAGYTGGSCGEEIALFGGSTYSDVDREARRAGWKIIGGRTHMDRRYLCPLHKSLTKGSKSTDATP
jgi:hypothetical protein